jgi:hypothetical protein
VNSFKKVKCPPGLLASETACCDLGFMTSFP